MPRKIVIEPLLSEKIYLGDVDAEKPIFARKIGSADPCGMLVREKDGWILRVGDNQGAYGYSNHLKGCLECGETYDYEFIVY